MAGGGVGEAALLETVLAAETAGAVVGGAEVAGGLGALAGAGELAGLAGAAGTGAGMGAGAGLAAEAGGLPSILQNTAVLNPEIAAATQAAMQPGVVPSALEAGANLYQPGLAANTMQGTNFAQMMGAPGVDFAGGTAQQALQSAAEAVAPAIDPNVAMSEALRADPSLTMGPANPYPTPGGVNLNDALSKALAQAPDLTQGGKNAEPGVLDQLGKLYDKIPTAAKYGLGALGAVKGLNYLEGNKYGTPEKEEYKGPLSKFKYDPSRYSPLVPQPRRMAGGGLSDLGGYSDGGRMLKGPGDGMSDSIPATIAGKQPARLANDEFVVPADVVSHLGNGSSDAGAKQLYRMMDKVRAARTGKKSQAKQINPDKYMPA